MQITAREEFARGWRTLLACAIGNGFGLSGLAFYTFGVFVVPLVDAFGWSRGQVSSAATFLLLGTCFTAPVVGTIIDRFGAKRAGLVSMFALSVGYVLLTQVSGTVAVYYAMWLMMSLIGGGTTPVVWTRAINLWFDKGRGFALGLALAGSGTAGIFGPPVITAVIEKYGWQAGFLAMAGAIFFIAIPLIALLFNDHAPHDRATEVAAAPTRTPARTGIDFKESLKHSAFWKIAIGFFFIAAIIAGLIINLVPLLIDRNLTPMAAAQVAGIMGFAVVFGRIGVGFLVDHFRVQNVTRILFGITAVGCLLLTIEDAPTWMAIVAVLSLGLAAAAEIDLVAFLTARYFGMKSYGKIYGVQLTIFYFGAAVGPVAVGAAYDVFGSYLSSLYAAVGILIVGSLIVGSLGKAPEFATPDV